jgi:hypothetical protein
LSKIQNFLKPSAFNSCYDTEDSEAPANAPAEPPPTDAAVQRRFLNSCSSEIRPQKILAISAEDIMANVTVPVMKLPRNSFAALFIAAAP